jgi:hypothetical protein
MVLIDIFGIEWQTIEARDRDYICTEYWRSRPHATIENRDNQNMSPQDPPLVALRGLFQRALLSLLMSNRILGDNSRQQACQILDEEIAKQWH